MKELAQDPFVFIENSPLLDTREDTCYIYSAHTNF